MVTREKCSGVAGNGAQFQDHRECAGRQTVVVNIKTGAKFDFYIGRPGPLGNPFVVGVHGTRIECVEKYRLWAPTQKIIMKALVVISGSRLGCFCKPKACHGDVLVEMIETYCPPQSPSFECVSCGNTSTA